MHAPPPPVVGYGPTDPRAGGVSSCTRYTIDNIDELSAAPSVYAWHCVQPPLLPTHSPTAPRFKRHSESPASAAPAASFKRLYRQ